jgi:hypothetical protein
MVRENWAGGWIMAIAAPTTTSPQQWCDCCPHRAAVRATTSKPCRPHCCCSSGDTDACCCCVRSSHTHTHSLQSSSYIYSAHHQLGSSRGCRSLQASQLNALARRTRRCFAPQGTTAQSFRAPCGHLVHWQPHHNHHHPTSNNGHPRPTPTKVPAQVRAQLSLSPRRDRPAQAITLPPATTLLHTSQLRRRQR